MSRSARNSLLRTGRAVLVAYLVVLLMLMFFENKLIYIPSKYPNGNWEPENLPVEDVYFTAADGTKLHGWYLEHAEPRGFALFAHGNAGNVAGRAEVLRIWRDRLGVSILVFDYRGYGRSKGSPNETGVLQDARAARTWLANRAGIDEPEVILFGRSLGGAVAVDLAADGGARALVLESTFTSLPDVAAEIYPWVPVRLLMRSQLNSLEKIASYHGPAIMSHGDMDEIIPYELGQRLFDAVPSTTKRFIAIDGSYHNDLPPNWYYDELEKFLFGSNGASK